MRHPRLGALFFAQKSPQFEGTFLNKRRNFHKKYSQEHSSYLHIVNFSGGKDSTYMLLQMIQRGMPIDAVLNADTGMEFPAMYDHINQVEAHLLRERGLPIIRLKPKRTFEELMFHAIRNGKGPGYGWPGASVRWCTGQLKVHLIQEFTRTLQNPVLYYIAFAADEAYRLDRSGGRHPSKRYPLIDWNVTGAQALAGCYEAGFTWGGLYNQFRRVSCWCCPLQSLEELRTLKVCYPELWSDLRRLDDQAIAQFGWDNAYGRFRPHESVRMLDVRFAFEQEWLLRHKTIRTKQFYTALRTRYAECAGYIGSYALENRPEYSRTADELLRYITDEDLAQYRIGSETRARERTPCRRSRKKVPNQKIPSR